MRAWLNGQLGAMIVADKISKRFGNVQAVDQLSLSIRKGETLGLLGPNGAGKTTTISMLVGLLKPDSGSVTLGEGGQSGRGAPTDPSVRRQLGIAPQALSLYEELTARENLDFFGQLYGLAGDRLRQRRQWALDFAGLTDRSNGRVGTFSGGMKRRLNLAVALIHEPQAVLLDEPTVGVDPQSRNHLFESIERLRAEGMTILYTTHYMEEAQRLCDRVAIVDQGRLLALDTVDRLIQQYGSQPVVQATIARNADSISLPGERNGNELRFESDQPVAEISRLISEGVQFQTVTIQQPDLESVFLALTGRKLRDD